MDNTKILAAFVLILVIYAFFLHAQGKLYPMLETITAKTNTPASPSLAMFSIAIVAFLVLSSFIPPEYSTALAVLIIADVLLGKEQHSGASYVSILLNPNKYSGAFQGMIGGFNPSITPGTGQSDTGMNIATGGTSG